MIALKLARSRERTHRIQVLMITRIAKYATPCSATEAAGSSDPAPLEDAKEGSVVESADEPGLPFSPCSLAVSCTVKYCECTALDCTLLHSTALYCKFVSMS